jgi:protein TonB
MALSLALHGLALVPLLFAGSSGSTPIDEPAFLVEVALAAPAPSEVSVDLPAPDQPPSVEAGEFDDRMVELPAPEEPPPLTTAELNPAVPSMPRPQAQPKPKPPSPPSPARPAQKPAVTQTESAPNTGTAQATQTADAQQQPIIWEHHPRFRTPPRPAAYPSRAIELGHQGEALVRVRLEASGEAAEILLWRGTGHEMLDKAALAAVRGWQFLPAMRQGRAVAAWVEIPVRFHLR